MSPRIGLDKTTVVRAAGELADRAGLEQVTLASLAESLGIKTPSLYNHIGGLPGLRRELMLYGLSLLKEALTEAAIGKSGDDAVVSVCLAYVAFVRLRPGLYDAAMLPLELADTEVAAASESVLQLLLSVLSVYALSRQDALHTVRGLRSMSHGFASLEQRGGFNMNLDRDESFTMLIRTYLRGLHQTMADRHSETV